MENASKALIMAGEILIGIMIVSIAVYLFNMMGEYSRNTNKTIEDSQIAQFNSQFLKYYGSITDNNGNTEPIKCTIHDIVSLANLANKNNEEYELNETDDLYITIKIKNEVINDKDMVELIKDNSLDSTNNVKYFKCEECNINQNTGRVKYMKFVEI